MTLAHEPAPARVEWLDGVRALAALFVVVHHIWLSTIGGFPGNNGPWPSDFLVYGHLAVAVFIVVSGFSLALRPARHGTRLREGALGFFERRFWRIVPPYWAALALAAALLWLGVMDTPTGAPFQARDVIINALLLQDTFQNVSPTGVVWSIAVEWHIYFLFPLVLWSIRRFGMVVALSTVATIVAVQYVLGRFIPFVALFDRFTPQFLVLFVLGVVGALAARNAQVVRWARSLAIAATVILLLLFVVLGPVTVVDAYFWVDLGVGATAAAAFIAMAGGRLRSLRSVLSHRWLVKTGHFAYSIYLVHPQILGLVRHYLVDLSGRSPTVAFWLFLAVGLPSVVFGSWLFYVLCERPFVYFRGFLARRDRRVPPTGGSAADSPRARPTGSVTEGTEAQADPESA